MMDPGALALIVLSIIAVAIVACLVADSPRRARRSDSGALALVEAGRQTRLPRLKVPDPDPDPRYCAGSIRNTIPSDALPPLAPSVAT